MLLVKVILKFRFNRVKMAVKFFCSESYEIKWIIFTFYNFIQFIFYSIKFHIIKNIINKTFFSHNYWYLIILAWGIYVVWEKKCWEKICIPSRKWPRYVRDVREYNSSDKNYEKQFDLLTNKVSENVEFDRKTWVEWVRKGNSFKFK